MAKGMRTFHKCPLAKGPPDAWWTLLGSEQINRLVSLAQAHLAIARERIRAARGAWYPQLEVTAAVQRTRYGAPVLGSLARDFPPFSAYTAGPTVSYITRRPGRPELAQQRRSALMAGGRRIRALILGLL
jgi:outer membrane protein TolC